MGHSVPLRSVLIRPHYSKRFWSRITVIGQSIRPKCTVLWLNLKQRACPPTAAWRVRLEQDSRLP
jgi:hypothetical protein